MVPHPVAVAPDVDDMATRWDRPPNGGPIFVQVFDRRQSRQYRPSARPSDGTAPQKQTTERLANAAATSRDRCAACVRANRPAPGLAACTALRDQIGSKRSLERP